MMMMMMMMMLVVVVVVVVVHLTWSGSKDAVLCQGPAVVDQPAGEGDCNRYHGRLSCKGASYCASK